MKLSSSLRTAVLAATAALLSAGAQAGPMPTHVSAMKSMVDQSTTEVRWVGGWGGGWRGGFGYRGGLGYRGLGYGLAAGAVVGGAIASSAYYGGYYPAYSYVAVPHYSYVAVPHYGYAGYGYGGGICPPGGYYGY